MSKSPNVTKKMGNKKKATRNTPKMRLTMSDLYDQINCLKRQLESERRERHLLIETLHGLSRLVSITLGSKSRDEIGSIETDDQALSNFTAPVAAGFFSAKETRATEIGVPCSLDDDRILSIVYSSIMIVDDEAFPFDEDTKLGPDSGLGWDKFTKRHLFNLILNSVKSKGCHFSALPGDFESLETVGAVTRLVKQHSK